MLAASHLSSRRLTAADVLAPTDYRCPTSTNSSEPAGEHP